MVENIEVLKFTTIWYVLLTMFTIITGLNTGIFIEISELPIINFSSLLSIITSIPDIIGLLFNVLGIFFNLLTFNTIFPILNILLWSLRVITLLEIVIIARG